MADTYPGLRADCARLIGQARALILLCEQTIGDALRADPEATRTSCVSIAEQGEEIAEAAEAFRATTDHFVTYDDPQREGG